MCFIDRCVIVLVFEWPVCYNASVCVSLASVSQCQCMIYKCVTVPIFVWQVCHSVSVCDVTDKKPYRSKRATPQSTTSGTATYSVAGVNNKLVNTPPRITSALEVGVSEDEGFQLQMKAVDSEGDHLSFLLNETAPVSMGNVSLELNGLLTYTPCVDCYGEDAVYYTVWEQRLDNEPPLFVEGKLIIKIRNLPDSPTIQMYHKGHDVIPPSSVFMVSMEENTGSASMDMVYVLAAYDPDYMDNVKLTFDPPQHGNLTQYNQLTKVVLTEQDCSQPWQSRRPLWDQLTNIVSSSVTSPQVSLPNPCGTDLITRHLAWVVTMFKYRPFYSYFGEDVIKVRVPLCLPWILENKIYWKMAHMVFLDMCFHI